jgi:hypothetical protein
VVATPIDTSPRAVVVLLTERTRPFVVTRSHVQLAMHSIGLHLEGLDEMLEGISESPEDDGSHYPVLILVDGWMQVGFVEAHALSRGGNA